MPMNKVSISNTNEIIVMIGISKEKPHNHEQLTFIPN